MSNNKRQKEGFGSNNLSINKKWFAIGVIVILFIAGIVGGWLYVGYNQKAKEDKLVAQELKRTEIVDSTAAEAQKIIDSGGKASQAEKLYDTAIKEAVNDSGLTNRLLLDEATLYFNDNDFDKALTTAFQAETVVKDDNVEQFIAQIYEKKGDSKNAIKYYQQAITLVDKTQPMADSDIKYYQTRITALGGVVN